MNFISTLIAAANKASNPEDNLKAGDISFTAEKLSLLDNVSKLYVEYPGRILEAAKKNRD